MKQLVDDDYYHDDDDDDDDGYDDYDDGYSGGSSTLMQSKKKKKTAQAKTPAKNLAATAQKAPSQNSTTTSPSGNKSNLLKGTVAVASRHAPASSSTASQPPSSIHSPPGQASYGDSKIKQTAALATSGLTPQQTKVSMPKQSEVVSASPNHAQLPTLPFILRVDATISPTSKTTNIPLTVVVLGHVDAGKSTVTGHLLFYYSAGMTGATSSTKKRNLKTAVNFAWLLDEDEREREHGVTMDIATKVLEFGPRRNAAENGNGNDPSSWSPRNFSSIVLQDAPGHADYVPAMITGTAAADAALLTVDATDLSHTALQAGQLREHVYLAKGLGVNQVLVAINKMDLVGWDNEQAYRTMEHTLLDFLTKQVGYAPSKIRCLPVSGLSGTNIFPRSSSSLDDKSTALLRTWYHGPSLLEALDSFEPPVQQQQKLIDKPLRMIVSDVQESSGNVNLRAKIVSGWVKQGESLVVLPVGDDAVLSKFTSLHTSLLTATSSDGLSKAEVLSFAERQLYGVAGELLDCTVAGIDAQRLSTGSILVRSSHRPILAARCRAKIFVLDGLSAPLIRGAQMIFHMHHIDIPCHFSALLRTVQADGVGTLKEQPRALSTKSTAIVELQLAVPVCMEAFTDCRALGRFVLRRSGESIAVGRIEQVLV